jgi:hypothetical protein
MKADLERLLISEVELLELTGFDRQQLLPSNKLKTDQNNILRAIALGFTAIAFVAFVSIFLPALRLAGIIFLISLTLGALSFAIEFAEVAVLCFCVALVSAIYSLYVLTGATVGLIALCLGLAIASGGMVWLLARWGLQQWRISKSSQKKTGIPLVVMRLFKEVDKCNKTILDIDIFDRLKDAGNAIKFESRELAIAALRMTRNDIVRALKTERILREHPDFHPDRFDIDLNAFESIQIHEQAKEYGRIFDATLQIAIDVQKAMSELQEFTSD